MHKFTLREIKNADMETELNLIGFDKSYAHKAVTKFNYKNIKIYDLTSAQANILKQTALSVGCDCATHREVITGKIEKSDCILGGSISEIQKVAEKLQFQPFGLKELGKKLSNSLAPLRRRQGEGVKLADIPNITNNSFSDGDTENSLAPMGRGQGEGVKLVGILNITDNSFSDGGLYNDFESAKTHLLEMINDGADIIDIGAESTKPYSSAVPAKEQLEKLLPIIDFAKDKTIISIDTRSSLVAEECLRAGAHIINDVSGLEYDEKMADVIAKYNCPVIIQHSKGTPENMQNSPHYNDVMEEIFIALKDKIEFARSKGIENIITDPGIGFGKTVEHNFEIIKRIEEFKALGYPIMLGVSRKSLLGDLSIDEKDVFTVALNSLAIVNGIDYIRVHNVKLHRKLLSILENFQK